MIQVRVTIDVEETREYYTEVHASNSFVLSDSLAGSDQVRQVVAQTISAMIPKLIAQAVTAMTPPVDEPVSDLSHDELEATV